MRNLLTSFMDQRETIGNLLAPFLTGQPQQFAKQPNPNMLLQGAEAAQQPAPPLSAPTEVLRKQVAEVPRAVDPMPTHSTSQAMPAQPPQSKSGGFFDGLSKFGESDFGQRLGDMMLGWGMGGTMQDSLSKGSQMIAAGNQDRKAKKEQFSTAEWLKKQGMDEEEAKYVAGNSQALNAYLIALRKGVDPMQALQQRKMELEINKLENPQLSPSDQLAREKFEWDKTQGGEDSKAYKDVQARAAIAEQYGLKPDDAAYQSYVMTGKMPREDASPLTATDKKAILEADEGVMQAENTIEMLKGVIAGKEGETLNDKAGYGWGAGTQSWLARNDPTGFFDEQKGQATAELDNIMTTQALTSLKSIFGGNPTEGERAILLDIQASSSKSPAERKVIIERAIKLADRRLAFNKERANQLRGGTFYKTDASGGSNGAPAAPQPLEPANINRGGAQVGAIEDGYRFKGGNPSDPNNWEKVQ